MTAGRRSGAPVTAALLAAVLLLAGCGAAAPLPPQVRVADLRLLESTVFEQRFEIDLRIGNPNDFALPLDGLIFELEVNGEAFARGFSDQRVTVPRLGERLISVAASTTLLDVVRQLQLLSERGDLSYRLRGLTYLNNLQRRSVPYESEGSFRLWAADPPGLPV
ncbi:MAG TPA: LEA type 2 family protein [Kiloniellaceae bacterium]